MEVVKVVKYLEQQMLFGESINKGEFALQLIFTDWNGTYEGQEKDLLDMAGCQNIQQLYAYLAANHSSMNFIKSATWKKVYR
jgi:hypothetical protein